jgi:serine/threonine protein kinase
MSGVGTRRYMAPETLTSKCYNAKADVYSWAMVVCQMFTLNRPYSEHSVEEHTRLVCHGGERPALDSSVPQALRALLSQSWCQSISERCSISAAIRFLEKELQEVPILYSKASSAMISEVIHRLQDKLNEEKMEQLLCSATTTLKDIQMNPLEEMLQQTTTRAINNSDERQTLPLSTPMEDYMREHTDIFRILLDQDRQELLSCCSPTILLSTSLLAGADEAGAPSA